AQEALLEGVLCCLTVDLRHGKQSGDLCANPCRFLLYKAGQLRLSEVSQMAEAIEGGEPTGAKAMGEQHHIIHLHILALGLGSGQGVHYPTLIKDLRLLLSWTPFAQGSHELVHAIIGHEDMGGE